MAKSEKLGDIVEFDRLNALFIAGKADEFTAEEHLWFRDKVLAQWEESKSALEIAKENEMTQRKQVVAFAFDPEKKKGTERIELANGYELKSVKKLNYNVNQDTVNDALDKIEALDEQGKFIVERIIKWKAELSVSEYNDLDERYRKIIDEVITTSDGAPTLEIVPPKGQKRK